MSAGNIFALETSGAYTIAEIYTGIEAQALAGAATAGATADAGINEFVIDGGGLLPPSVLMGSAIGRATASGTLFEVYEAPLPRSSIQWTLRVTPDGQLTRVAA
jgi:hypothetical protein